MQFNTNYPIAAELKNDITHLNKKERRNRWLRLSLVFIDV